MKPFCAVVVSLAVLLFSPSPRAEDVRIEHLGLDLVANFETGSDKNNGGSFPTLLIVHGTLAHHRMELVRSLQTELKARGIATLAPTLSLGLNARQGMFDCRLEHDHRSTDASDEIAAWIDWLKARGRSSGIALLGHSRGAEQAARFLADTEQAAISHLVLLAPPSDTPEQTIERYARTAKADLRPLVAAARKLVEDSEEDTVLEVPGFLICPAARVTAAAFLDYYDVPAGRSTFELLKTSKVPVLVVAGSADDIAPDVASRLRQAAPGALVDLAVIDGADHFFRDLFAEDVADKVKAFLAKR